MTTSKTTSRRLVRIVAVGLLCLSPALFACGKKKAEDTQKNKFESRIHELESKEEMRSVLLDFTRALDQADPAALTALGPKLTPDFSLDLTDMYGEDLHFEGLQGLVLGFGPILSAAQADLVPSSIQIYDMQADQATACFKYIGSVKPPPELGFGMDVKMLVTVDNVATFKRDDDGKWKLRSFKMTKHLAYPGSIEDLDK